MAATLARTHGTTGVRIAITLRGLNLADIYSPGDRIRQDELAERHGASRPMREALPMPEAEGLARLVANTGAWVSTPSMGECQELYPICERLEPICSE
ncbi:GntR family transcriptional regulator [Arthrobacter sp. B0490]|uniref:GntR family transcriptional regulator n=1 Tax=Arthrobacter sp. B0490 TaxID=2058891 RepID=UPI0011B0E55D|nr:GntR family transcriptional regulator [Arthrobacter sp. B0490]